MDNRRTIAATDKIYLNFTCNGEPLGSFVKTGPKLWLKVDGTGPFKRITIVRNEKDWKHFNEFDGKTFDETISDEEMLEGNRYSSGSSSATGTWLGPPRMGNKK